MQARYPGAKKCAPPTKPSHRCGSRLSPIVQWDPAVSFIFFPTLSRAGSHEDDDGGPLVDDDGGRWQRTSARVSLNPSPSSEHGKGPVGKAGRPGTRGWSWGSYRVLATVEAVGPSVCVCVCVCVWVGGCARACVCWVGGLIEVRDGGRRPGFRRTLLLPPAMERGWPGEVGRPGGWDCGTALGFWWR
jgi:hypothetical protein